MTMRNEGDRSIDGRSAPARDTEAALQEELRRESAERDELGGDTATNRNLSGSSTWVTLGAVDAESGQQTPSSEQQDAPSGPPRP